MKHEDFIGMHPLVRIVQGKTAGIQTIEDPKLHRKGKVPVRREFGEQDQDTHHLPETPKDHYKRIYFIAIDTITHVSSRDLSKTLKST